MRLDVFLLHLIIFVSIGFRSVLKRIEIWVTSAAKTRHADEKKDLLQKRQKLVDDIYHKFANSLFTTDMWSSLPPADVVRELDYFRDFINSETEEVGEISAERSIEQLNAFIETSFEKPKRALTFASLLTTGKMKDYPGKGHEREFDVLELVTSVFSCPPCEAEAKVPSEASALVGWNELKNHLYCTTSKEKPSSAAISHDKKGKSRLEFPLRADKGGAKDAIWLLKMLELDPSTTVAEQLDILDPRFLCLCCPREVSKGMAGRKAMGWRDCVCRHPEVIERYSNIYFAACPSASLQACHISRHALCSFLDAADGRGSTIRPLPRAAEQLSSEVFLVLYALLVPLSTWCQTKSCNYPSQNGVRYYSIVYGNIGLILFRHKIERPRQDVDFVPVPGKNQPRKMFVVILEPPTNFRCLKCPEPRNLRLWSLRSLQAHLSDK